ncbi:MAG: radical SAM family heme chaperone HemW [Alphaproteobacteria bacterium]|nr:MAG: radical SAM family heme chaperone HemW [Alphaproteobacteria bacterium]
MSPLTPLAVYVHWPWCKAKCPYCDFNSHAGTIQEEPYIEGLLQEIRGWAAGCVLDGREIGGFAVETHRLESIFFGGGTPSLMQANSIGRVINACRSLGVLDDTTEVTVECNPTSFATPDDAQRFFNDLRLAGVNRVSIGIQGLKQEWLRFLGREHSVNDALATLEAAQAVFRNVNCDVIYGLPGQTLEDWENLLKHLSARGLPHISAYQLTVEKNTRFHVDVKRGAWVPIDADLEADFFEATRETLLDAGYENYEISNFAKPGFACRHNVHVWRYGEYLGIGAGAHGRITDRTGTRLATTVIRQPEGYLRRMTATETPPLQRVVQTTALTLPETAQEAVFSGLRLAEGCNMENLSKIVPAASCEEALSARETAHLVGSGFLNRTPTHMMLTETGWPRLNSILSRLLNPLPAPVAAHQVVNTTDSGAYKNLVTVVIS